MLKIILTILLIFGLNFTFWSLVGLLRLLWEKIASFKNRHRPGRPFSAPRHRAMPNNVAIIMSAHNEELVINDALNALKKIIKPRHIYVANDGSKDQTSRLVTQAGCHVLDIYPRGGKAKALVALLKHFRLCDIYEYVVFVDADTRLSPDYLLKALPILADPNIVAVAGYARSQWKNNIYIAYRSRIWFTIQTFFRFGMSWRYTNVNMIVPGFASIYRASALKKIDIAKPGLVIEDYNMTFELHQKKLGQTAHSPAVSGYTQDPDTFTSYCRQIKRWNLGFWQTVRKNGFWFSAFWVNLIIYLTEITLVNFLTLIFPLFIFYALLVIVFHYFGFATGPNLHFAYFIFDWLLLLWALDYFYTILTALVNKQPRLLIYGPFLLFFRWLDAHYFFCGLILAYSTVSDGIWQIPTRWRAPGNTSPQNETEPLPAPTPPENKPQ